MKVFVVLSRIPYPLEKGDKLRAYHQIKELHKEHQVHLCCLNIGKKPSEKQVNQVKKITTTLHIIQLSKIGTYFRTLWAFLGKKPFQVAYFFQKNAKKRIEKLIHNIEPDHLFCQLIRTSEYIKNQHSYPKTIDYMDAMSINMERRASISGGIKKWFYKIEAKRSVAYENLIFDYFDHQTIIAEQDRDHIFHPKRKEINVVPNGVDSDFFKPPKEQIDKAYDIVFVGNMGYLPNVDAAQTICKEILPHIQKEIQNTKVLLAGAHPAREVLQLESENISISGWMDDIREAYWKSRIFIAPMSIGSGQQNKVLEAMSIGIPCIVTPLVNNAIGAKHEEQVLIASSPQEFAECYKELKNTPEKAAKIGNAARQFILNQYSWESSTQQLLSLFSEHQQVGN